MKRELHLGEFFPEELNLYGDGGNITILKKRCEWRGITLHVHPISSKRDVHFEQLDLFFMGGASDREQALVTEELQSIKQEFKAAIEDGVGGLSICGGYQFLGNYYQLHDGTRLNGLDVLDFYTENRLEDATDIKHRLIGDLFVQSPTLGRLIGYENHAGQTFHSYETLGDVVKGYGNNREGKTEGLRYKNLIGTYMHGPILTKAPQLADDMLSRALHRKYGDGTLTPLDDSLHQAAIDALWKRTES